MAGVKQFDRDEVLERAMVVFWRNGYQATSIQDLVEATGVNRGSLYPTFGDKRRFFLAVLEHYSERFGKPMMAELNDPNPRRAIEQMFKAIIRRTSDTRWPRGCLYTNTSLECPGAGEDIGRKIAELLGQQESAIYKVLRRAQAEGSLDVGQDARALARFFTGVAHGLNAVNKAAPDPAMLEDMVAVAMRVWDAAEPSATGRGSGKSTSRSRAKSVKRL
jgi:TetR/AcrR family transcriptional repressor of nem operon